jgi:hypothetical protein
VARSKQIESGIIADFDEEKHLLGLEILYANKRSSLEPSKKAARKSFRQTQDENYVIKNNVLTSI